MLNGANVGASAREFIASVEGFKKNTMNKAAAIALNRTAEGVRVDGGREIRARFKIKMATVNKSFSITKASADRLVAVVNVRGRPLNLGNFGARQTRKGVSVQVKGTRKLIPHAFIVKVASRDGESTFGVVFIRDAHGRARPARLPIKALTSVDVPGVFSLKEVQQIMRNLALDRFSKELPAALRALELRR